MVEMERPEQIAWFQRFNEVVFGSVIDDRYPSWLEEILELFNQAPQVGERDFHLESLKKLKEKNNSQFQLFVIGEGKFGKSTLVNVLLGERIAEMGESLPVTWIVSKYIWNEGKKGIVETYLEQDGKEQIISERELERELIRLKQDRFSRPVTQLRFLSKKPVFSELVVVDTPGLDQEFPEETEEQNIGEWMDWLEVQFAKADACLWLIHARRTHSKMTLDFLKQISRYGKPIYYVLNQKDLLTKEELENGKKRFLHEHPPAIDCIYPISADWALNGNDIQKKESGISELEKCIGLEIVSKKMLLKSTGVYFQLKTLKREQNRKIETELKVDKKRLKAIQSFRDNFQSVVDVWGRDSREALNRFIEEYEKKVQSNISTTQWDDSLPKIEGAFDVHLLKLELGIELMTYSDNLSKRLNELKEKLEEGCLNQTYDNQGKIKNSSKLPMPGNLNIQFYFNPKIDLSGDIVDFIKRNIPGKWLRDIFIDRLKENHKTRQKMKCELVDLNKKIELPFSECREMAQKHGFKYKTLISDKFKNDFGDDPEIEKRIIDYQKSLRVKEIGNAYIYSTINLFKKLSWPQRRV